MLNLLLQRIVLWLCRVSPEFNVRRQYYLIYHKKLRLRNPQTFDEKLQWLKLKKYAFDPLVKQCADKYAVRQYVKDSGCDDILNELYAVYNSVDEIDWNKLPHSFVIKLNVGCGYNLICRDKEKLNIEETKIKLTQWVNESRYFYQRFSEMQYKDVPLRIICERLLETEDGSLPVDYKVFCFDGVAKYVMLCTKRHTGTPEFYFFDRNKKLVRLNKRGLAAPNDFSIEMPKLYDDLFTYAELLSKGFPFVRADFYINQDHIIFGELTFTPCTGIDPNIPYEQNLFLGNLIHLPQ